MRMKILVLSNYANGLFLFRKEVLQAFQRQGYETVISVPYDENCRKLEDMGFLVLPTEFERRGSNPVHDFKLFLKYMKLLKEQRPDVVLTYTIKPNLYGGLACRIKRIPYFVNITGLGTAVEKQGLMGRALIAFYRVAVQKAACVFFQNEGNKQFMLEHGVGKKRNRLLPGSGVNLKEHPYESYPCEDEGIIFLAVLRIMKDKGIEEYLTAAQQIGKEFPGSRFYLAGEYEQESKKDYEPWIQRLSDEGKLKYFGHIDNVPEVMAKSHVIVHPSYHEGLSNVLLEAAACGRPVLASDVPGCRETLQNGLSGLTFPAKDAQGLTHAMKTILSYSKSDRREMGIRGREYVEEVFDRQKVIGIYLEEIGKSL